MPDDTKVCTKCGAKKPLSAFHRAAHTPTGYNGRCKSCRRIPSDELRRIKLRTKYGITELDFERLVEAQGARCAICDGDKPLHRHGVWSIDHDHVTGEVRGLLCGPCNNLLGRINEDPERWASKIRQYLDTPPAREVLRTARGG